MELEKTIYACEPNPSLQLDGSIGCGGALKSTASAKVNVGRNAIGLATYSDVVSTNLSENEENESLKNGKDLKSEIMELGV